MDNEAEYSSEYSKFNLYFLEEVKKNSERILEKLKELQMRT